MSNALKWGLITGMVNIFQSLITNLLGYGPGEKSSLGITILLSLVFLLITFFTIYMGIKAIRDEELNGEMNVGLALRKGMKIALIAGVVGAIYTFIYVKIIDPDLISRMTAQVEQQWEENHMTEEQMEKARGFMGIFMNVYLMATMALLMTCFWAIFQSLIAGAILKNDPPPTMTPTEPLA